jgi:hypothetical protein
VSAGLHHEPPIQPIPNVEDLVSKKVMVIKLTSGEYLISAVFQTIETGLNLTHPYEIVTRAMKLEDNWAEVPVLKPHCPYVVNRLFFIPWSHIIYAKEATENFSNLYLEEFSRRENNDYIRLMTNYKNFLTAKQEAKSVVMIGDSLVKIDGDKIFVTGKETKH